MAVIHTSIDKFTTDVIQHKGVVLVDFYADWCVSPETQILLTENVQIPAKDIRKNDRLVGLGENGKDSGIVSYSAVTSDEGHCQELTVETGRKIKVTDGHLLYTPDGWKATQQIVLGEKVAIYPVGDAINQTRVNNQDIILSRLLGMIFSDGTLYYQEKNRYYEISFSVGQKQDVEWLSEDLSTLGFPRVHVKELIKDQEIDGRKFTTHLFRIKCCSKRLFELLKQSGGPVGAKKSQIYTVPIWIKKGSMAIKRSFLQGYLGGDGPKVTMNLTKREGRSNYNNTHINDLEFHKDSELKSSGLKLAREISSLLEEFGVDIRKTFIEEDSYIRADGKKSAIIHICFKQNYENAYVLSHKVGYAYCNQKQHQSTLVGEFIREILFLRQGWKDSYTKALQLSNQGLDYRKIAKMLHIHTSQAWAWTKGKTKATITKHGLRFDTWLQEKTKDAPIDFLWEKVIGKKQIFLRKVAKITVSPTHNFIANGFLSHNCGPCKITSPIIEELADDPEFREVRFVEVDVDADNDLAAQFNILSIPTFLIFKNGEVISQFVGARDKSGFESELKSAL